MPSFGRPFPDPDQYKGRPPSLWFRDLSGYIRSLVQWLSRNGGKMPTALLVYTPGGGIPARSSTTAGSATCDVVTWDGTSLDNSGNGTVTVYNAYGAAFSASKYVWCVLWGGTYWAVGQEC